MVLFHTGVERMVTVQANWGTGYAESIGGAFIAAARVHPHSKGRWVLFSEMRCDMGEVSLGKG